jgi:hypothetical protein
MFYREAICGEISCYWWTNVCLGSSVPGAVNQPRGARMDPFPPTLPTGCQAPLSWFRAVYQNHTQTWMAGWPLCPGIWSDDGAWNSRTKMSLWVSEHMSQGSEGHCGVRHLPVTPTVHHPNPTMLASTCCGNAETWPSSPLRSWFWIQGPSNHHKSRGIGSRTGRESMTIFPPSQSLIFLKCKIKSSSGEQELWGEGERWRQSQKKSWNEWWEELGRGRGEWSEFP